ncbi:MAG: Gldg family protein [Rubritalea sp.]|uniref:Gldg family protein n=1 Tax=Rubritalea sp. TaxID=2109375 RepID=UPI00324254BD
MSATSLKNEPELQESDDSSAAGPVKKINRFGLCSLALFQLVLAIICVVLLNFLSCTNHKRFDLTRHADFTLAQTTTQFLKSSEVRQRQLPIKMVAIIKQQSPYYLRLRGQLENYQRFSDNNIELEFIDPTHDRDRLQDFVTTYQRDITEETILIDARNTIADAELSPEEEKVNLVKHIRTIPVKSLFIEEFDRFNKKFISSWNDESHLTTYLVSAVEGTPRRFYFIIDKARIDEPNKGTPAWKNFQALLLAQNIQLSPLQISATNKIPNDAEGIAIIGPAFDFDEREIATLTEYWDRPSASLFITLNPNAKLKHFRRFLREYGISPQDNRVMSVSKSGKSLTSARAFFTQGPEVNQGLAHQATQLDGPSSGLEVMTSNDRLAIRNITPFALLQAADGWWGESKYTEPNPSFDAREDQGIIKGAANPTPVNLAAAVVRGRQNSDLTAPLTSRMVVIANTEFLRPDNAREEMSYFINSTINWLVGRESLIGIGPKPVYRKKITVQSAHKSFIDQVILIYLPLVSLLIGLLLWNSRRS